VLVSFTLLAALSVGAPPSGEAPADAFAAEPTWKRLGADLWFDPQGKRLVMRARVVLREGPLEHLLCLKATKEHEAILATAAIPRQIHAGLLLTGAETGHPVRFQPVFEPPTGSPIAIELQWTEAGKTRTADARRWVRDERKKALLNTDWVFAGSELFPDPVTKRQLYAADDGDLITVANFSSAILDLPFASDAHDTERSFVANTDQIPPRGTMVTMFLRPRPKAAVPKR
jgi:hypothetical protein